jgi:hypothetical protein
VQAITRHTTNKSTFINIDETKKYLPKSMLDELVQSGRGITSEGFEELIQRYVDPEKRA